MKIAKQHTLSGARRLMPADRHASMAASDACMGATTGLTKQVTCVTDADWTSPVCVHITRTLVRSLNGHPDGGL